MSHLFAPSVSITTTQRRRFFWAAWWSASPTREPFCKPDAFRGGARTRTDALRAAEEAAGRPLVLIEPAWARAWAAILVGKVPFPPGREARGAAARPSTDARSIWQTLGVSAHATVEEIKLAFRRRALATHPDHGGEAAEFRALRHAYTEALARRRRKR